MAWLKTLLLGATALLCTQVEAAVVPLSVTGILDSASATTTDFNSGGSISVNGYPITIPKNLIVQFPAAFVPFKDFAAGSFTGNEVSVAGNIVDGKAIAAQVEVAQTLLNAGTGVIQSIDFADGSMKIEGGPTLRINDPNAVYSKGYNANPFFTADDENPSITAFSGFPMCIPRSSSDTKCPSSNRPSGQRNFRAPNPLVMAPFAVGDYLEYSGIRVGGEVICFEITAMNVQITTSGVPAYIRVEDAIIGVVDASTNTEFADSRFIGYVSDSSVSVSISAIDVDPCTGDETERIVGSAIPRNVAGDTRLKWEFRAESDIITTYTREYRIKTSTGTKLTENGILAGQYVQPVTEWIYPEATVPGITPPPYDFSSLSHLAKGSNIDGVQFGQLSPWPGSSAPAGGPTCNTPTPTGTAPVANAGPDITNRPGVVITLRGKDDNNIPASDASYIWTQVSGPSASLTLLGASGLTASFTAPAQATPTVAREFQLKIALKAKPTVTATDTVAFKCDNTLADVVTIDSYTHTNSQSGTISVICSSNVVDGQNTGMTLNIDGPSARTVPMSPLGGGKWSYNSRSVNKPNTVRCTSNLKGTASRTTTTARRRKIRGVEMSDAVPF